MAIAPDVAQSISASPEELERRAYSTETLVKALNAMHQDGVIVLKNVIPTDIIDKINSKMCEDTERVLANPDRMFNHGVKSNFLQRPPTAEGDLLSEDVYFNPFVLQLANAYLGPQPTFNWLTANTALANTQGMRQPVHKDSGFDHPQFPYYFIANVPLCEFSMKNGATEFWLGSHAETTWNDQRRADKPEDLVGYYSARLGERIPLILDSKTDERAGVRPPIQPECRKGDIMIRDLRTWHAGMPNSSDEHRIMLALGYQSPHAPGSAEKMCLHLPSSQKEFFGKQRDDVRMPARWYEDDDLGKDGRRPEFLCPANILRESSAV